MQIPHPKPLLEAVFVQRYVRFIAAVELDGKLVEAHCVNPGRMEGLVRPGARVWLSAVPPESKRKLRYTLEFMEIDGVMIGANTSIPNWLAVQLIEAGAVTGLKRWRSLRTEVPYGTRSRIDILLETAKGLHYVEVKNCHLAYPDGCAYFPDSVSERAAEHVHQLALQVEAGHQASVLFVLQRPDAKRLRPSRLHDPVFSEAVTTAAQAGVVFRAIKLAPTLEGFDVQGMIPVDLAPYDEHKLVPFKQALDEFSGWKRRPKT